jgi:hypothetical protein
MLASVLLVGACQPTAPKTSPQAEAAADTSAAAAAITAASIQPSSYDTKEYMVMKPLGHTPLVAAESPKTLASKDAEMTTVDPATLKAMEAAPAAAKP